MGSRGIRHINELINVNHLLYLWIVKRRVDWYTKRTLREFKVSVLFFTRNEIIRV